MKRTILYCLLIIELTSCRYNKENFDSFHLNIKDKKLQLFFSNSNYYNLKGISHKDSSGSYNFKIKNNILNLRLKNKFINGFKKGFLFENPIEFYLHDLKKIESTIIKIYFNKYKSKKYNFIPMFNKENLEILKNRSSKIYRINESFELEQLYISDEFSTFAPPSLTKINFYNSSKLNLLTLKKNKLYPKGLDAFYVVHNPLTNIYSILPDLKRFDFKKNSLIDELKNKINFEKIEPIKSKDTILFEDDFIVNDNLEIENKIVIIGEGCKISFNKNSILKFKDSDVLFKGSNNKKIYVEGNNLNSFYFNNCNVEIKHTNFKKLSNIQSDSLFIPSAITFYNSRVNIYNSTFEENIRGDDYINFYNSNFTIRKIYMNNVIADAIDSDFSDGFIEDVNLNNIGNDGLDFSGSDVIICNSLIQNVYDKAISAGESSKISIENSQISYSELAIVVKDGSVLTSKSNYLNKNKINHAVFLKKNFYEPPSLKTDFYYDPNTNLFQKGVILNTTSKNFEYLDDVESLLYGNYYGRATN